ncbi:aminomethyl-transferring glycine dehydrogenase [Pendulispora albinea]|uniref:Glycine dehydrogenase (decarboxylating) n=1 Tax=Pendulispora albinea TaxID=2741071 RepID=A0ABZ2LQU6_9BACT
MSAPWKHPDRFVLRHVGPDTDETVEMLRALRLSSVEQLVDETVPSSIRLARPLDLPAPLGENELYSQALELSQKNEIFRSYLGMGYSDCLTPKVIQRNILENPGWYTQYTPYQAEIAQGRLEALLNYQTMVTDLTGLPVANASLLDEATAAAEAMHMAYALQTGEEKNTFFASETCHPQTLDVLRTRAGAIGISLVIGDPAKVDLAAIGAFGALVQYPATDGALHDYRAFAEQVHKAGGLFIVAADILSLALLTPPGEFGADVAVGSTQRFGVPLGYGGPHAAYLATKNEFVRKLPGRIIGVAQDSQGRPALRMALQTREQHIRREKATSNICTAQALLAVIAGMYAVYHGPRGIRAIAEMVHGATSSLAEGLRALGVRLAHDSWFDTLRVQGTEAEVKKWLAAAESKRINLRRIDAQSLGISLDETTTPADVATLLGVFGGDGSASQSAPKPAIPEALRRTSEYLTHSTFNRYHSETEMLRYVRKLEGRDLSLTHSMIPLGSCTMKLNATVEMMPISFPGFNRLHPYVPFAQSRGYQQIFRELESYLAEMTGFSAVSLQPNAGAQGEYAGLLAIRKYHESRGEAHRTVCIIPSSAHGTNPASAVMAGLDVVVVKCDEQGNIMVSDLEEKARTHRDKLGALMVTYPSTHGVFEEAIKKICAIIHEHGGQVYMDGANLNAQLGLCRPGDIGADVCHVNLHKTFCIPHGGGGPGMGPIAVAPHLAPFLPHYPSTVTKNDQLADVEKFGVGPVSAAPWGSASILIISWAYIKMMGAEGLTHATKVAILNANYIAERLGPHYPIVYRGQRGRVAHECILDVRPFKKTAGIEVDDVAKRLMDYGFHAPTMSFPIAGTLMVEPTESESKAELDRFCDAMIAIREEIRQIEEGRLPKDDNPLKNAPHTADMVIASDWKHPYPRELGAFPAPWTRDRKFWPPVGRLNNALGDRNLICTCPPIEEYAAG